MRIWKLLLFVQVGVLCSTGPRSQSVKLEKVCNLDDGHEVNADLLSQSVSLTNTDLVVRCLDNILTVAGQRYDKMQVRNLTRSKTASALVERYAANSLRQVVAVNIDHYSKLVSSRLYETMFTWIIGHEVTHHVNVDGFYEVEDDEAVNILKETLADENAGYYVGKLCPSATLLDLETILSSILTNNQQSIYHPPLKFRILAAQGGWLRAKGEVLSSGNRKNFAGVFVGKHLGYNSKSELEIDGVYQEDKDETVNEKNGNVIRVKNVLNGNIYIFNARLKPAKSYGIIYFTKDNTNQNAGLFMGEFGKLIDEWTNCKEANMPKQINVSTKQDGFGRRYRSDQIYKGEYIDGQRSNGTLKFSNGEAYTGSFTNNVQSGFGMMSNNKGEVYQGHWARDKKNGYGMEIKNKVVVREGCWVDDKYIGTKCN